MVTETKSSILKPRALTYVTSISELDTDFEALLIPEWKKAMQAEYNALIQNGTWSLVPFTPDMNLISSKWIFSVKYHKDGTGRGINQTCGKGFSTECRNILL